jgi:hypothetical protein
MATVAGNFAFIRGLEPHWAILIGAAVFFLFSLSFAGISWAWNRNRTWTSNPTPRNNIAIPNSPADSEVADLISQNQALQIELKELELQYQKLDGENSYLLDSMPRVTDFERKYQETNNKLIEVSSERDNLKGQLQRLQLHLTEAVQSEKEATLRGGEQSAVIQEYKRELTLEAEQKQIARSEASRLQNENRALRLEIDAWKKHDLIFEVDWRRSLVSIEMDERLDLVVIETDFLIRFEKRREMPVMVERLGMDLYEQRHSRKARKLKTRHDEIRLFANELTGGEVVVNQLKFSEPMSRSYQFRSKTFVYDPINTLADLVDKKHFLRLALEASDQEPFFVDVEVHWERNASLAKERPQGQ